MNKINDLIKKIAAEQTAAAQQIQREPAKVISVSAGASKAVVRLLNGSEPELLNKSGEELSAGDDVWIEYRTNPSSACIVLRNGAPLPPAYTTIAFKNADLYDDSAAGYNVNDVSVYNGVIYICTSPVTSAATFDPSKWSAITNTEGRLYIQPITETAYNSLIAKDDRTLYIITE